MTTDVNGNIAVASDPYSQAQDAASAIKLFAGELWYDTTKGIDYFGTILSKRPPLSLVRADFNAQALTVPGIVKSRVFFSAWMGRKLSGQVQIKNDQGNVSAASF